MNVQTLHPDCRTCWEDGKTDYPPEEHARDCDQCELYRDLALADNLYPWQRAILDVLLRGDIYQIANTAREQRRKFLAEEPTLTHNLPTSGAGTGV